MFKVALPALLLLLAAIAAPPAAAQAAIRVELSLPHAEMILPASDNDQMEVTVKVFAKGFVCVQETSGNGLISVQVKSDGIPYPAHYGATVQNNPKKFKIPQGKPGADGAEIELPAADDTRIIMEVDWSDARPTTDADFTYKIISETGYEQTATCPQQPNKDAVVEGEVMMKTIGIDKNVTIAQDCTPGDPRPECATDVAPPPGGESPGFNALFLIGAAALLAFVRRRRSGQ